MTYARDGKRVGPLYWPEVSRSRRVLATIAEWIATRASRLAARLDPPVPLGYCDCCRLRTDECDRRARSPRRASA